jgi:hypothetical protein
LLSTGLIGALRRIGPKLATKYRVLEHQLAVFVFCIVELGMQRGLFAFSMRQLCLETSELGRELYT